MKENKLRGAIYARFNDASELADKIGWTKQKLSNIINGDREPKLNEVQELATALEMDVVEVASFFLPQMSQNCD